MDYIKEVMDTLKGKSNKPKDYFKDMKTKENGGKTYEQIAKKIREEKAKQAK